MLTSQIVQERGSPEQLILGTEEYRQFHSYVKDKFLPRPHVSLIFHFEDRPTVFNDSEIRLESFFVVPIISHAVILGFDGRMDTFVVNCRPTVFSKLFDIDLSKSTAQRIKLSHQLFFPLWSELKNLRKKSGRAACFSEFVESLAPVYIPDAVDQLYDKIVNRGMDTSLKLLMNECNASKSTLLRRFISRTGVCPKTLMRIVRLNQLWKTVKDKNKKIDFQEMAYLGNYFDQAHFINDFKSIIGETPGFFFKRNLSGVRLLSGMQN
ncbi:MAG: AraC family transcriptional regulator [Chitinophagaceae bacterium]|nr:AraC family transcriptional regulator [Chitinophagaceae bacterium]